MEEIDRIQLAREWAVFDGTWTEFLEAKNLYIPRGNGRLQQRKMSSKRLKAKRERRRQNREKINAYKREWWRRRKRSDVAQFKRNIKTAEQPGNSTEGYG